MTILIVAMNGIRVGKLKKEPGGALAFAYYDDWIERSGARAISLSLPLQAGIFRGDRVFNFFDNLLPDNEQIRTRIQKRFRIPTKQTFDLLAQIGGDCVGAIQLYPEQYNVSAVDTMHAKALSDGEIGHLLKGYRDAPLGMEADVDDFRISLAGAQEKTALLWYKNQWNRPEGSTPTSHIFKLPVGMIDYNNLDLTESGENEWLCLKIAEQYGLPTAQAQLAEFTGQKVLIVERFDRRWSRDKQWLMRLPQEDFCQALGIAPAIKYEADGGPGIADIMALLEGSEKALRDRDCFFKSQILFWMLAAIDGHAKNFSLFIEPGSRYRLSPLYDIISAYPFMGSSGLAPRKAKMAMAVLGKNRHFHWSHILPRHFIATAKTLMYPEDKVRQMMAEMKAGTETVITAVTSLLPPGFPPAVSEAIFAGLRRQAARLP